MWYLPMDGDPAHRVQRARKGTLATDPFPEAIRVCPRCGTDLFGDEIADAEGHRVPVLHCILCGTYVEPGHVPDTVVVRTVRGPRGPRN
jgi:hypothetical protein